MRENRYILGLDIGTNSIGWALLRAEERDDRLVPTGLERTGVRIFEAGVAGSIERGHTESHAKTRREARMMRRNIFRNGQRLRRAFRMLQQAKLLPGDPSRPSRRDVIIKALDNDLRKSWTTKLRAEGNSEEEVKVAVHHNLTYTLRARGLDEKLEPYEIGRVLYHLAQRRGFKSIRKNIKGEGEDEKDQNSIQKEAEVLRQSMHTAGARTLGEYFSKCNPFGEDINKIRGMHTLRTMHQQEFEMLWTAQASSYPEILTPRFRQELAYGEYGMFWQRGLKGQKNLVGDCSLESGDQRAPAASLEFQRFRYLQKLNDTKILPFDGSNHRYLTPDERQSLVVALEKNASLSMTDAKALLGLKQRDKFNLGEGGETRFVGNRTAAKFFEIIGDHWIKSTQEEQLRIVKDYLRTKDEATPLARTAERLQLDVRTAERLAEIKLERDYCAYSFKALRKLLPFLEEGLNLHDASV